MSKGLSRGQVSLRNVEITRQSRADGSLGAAGHRRESDYVGAEVSLTPSAFH